jgi:hypothetical protein
MGDDERESWRGLLPDIVAAIAILIALALLIALAIDPREMIATLTPSERPDMDGHLAW